MPDDQSMHGTNRRYRISVPQCYCQVGTSLILKDIPTVPGSLNAQCFIKHNPNTNPLDDANNNESALPILQEFSEGRVETGFKELVQPNWDDVVLPGPCSID